MIFGVLPFEEPPSCSICKAFMFFFHLASQGFPQRYVQRGGRCNSQYSSRMEARNPVEPSATFRQKITFNITVATLRYRFFNGFSMFFWFNILSSLCSHDFCRGLSQPVPSLWGSSFEQKSKIFSEKNVDETVDETIFQVFFPWETVDETIWTRCFFLNW